jgi:ureidoglycolate amidohydrolase
MSGSPEDTMNVDIDQRRLQKEIDTLAGYSSEPAPVVTRVVFSQADQDARGYLAGLFAEAGLLVREDAIGNTFARWVGSRPELAAVGTGSHIDAIPNAGRYDGTVGVLGGLEAIRGLQRVGFQPERSIELVLFTAEEPTRFDIGCLGSRMLAGVLTPEAAAALLDSEGLSLDQLRRAAGFHGELASVRLLRGYYERFVELHIEQGPLLERENLSIGIVQAIAAPAGLNFTIEGEGGHAGTVLMPARKDAFVAAAELAVAIEKLTLELGGADTVATNGKCEVFPGALNSIASRVKLTLDLRDTDRQRRDRVLHAIVAAGNDIARRRGIKLTTDLINADDPAPCDTSIVDAIQKSCETHQAGYLKLVSRAYHDSLFMDRICPIGMIFIPSRGGVSHRPDEYSTSEQIATGVTVLAETLAALAGGSA